MGTTKMKFLLVRTGKEVTAWESTVLPYLDKGHVLPKYSGENSQANMASLQRW